MNFAGTRSVAARRDADAAAITEAARLLKAGGLVAFPTETVYGLGADATNAAAIAKLYAAKGRPSFNPLIAHVSDAEAAMREGVFSALARKLATNEASGVVRQAERLAGPDMVARAAALASAMRQRADQGERKERAR